MFKLRPLDLIILVAVLFLSIGVFAIVGFSQRQVSAQIVKTVNSKNILFASVLGQAIERELTSGNFRYAWLQIHRGIKNSSIVAFELVDKDGKLLVDDSEYAEAFKAQEKENWPLILDEDGVIVRASPDSSGLFVERALRVDQSNDPIRLRFLFENSALLAILKKVQLLFWALTGIFMFGVIILFGALRIAFVRSLANLGKRIVDLFNERSTAAPGDSLLDPYFPAHLPLRKISEDLTRARAQMKEKSRREAIGHVAQQVAHDIRSPISALSLAVEQIEAPAAQIIKAATERINKIADDLLKFSVRDLQAQPIGPLVEQIVNEQMPKIVSVHGASIEWFDNSSNALALVDPETFKRIIANLLSNSVEALVANGKITLEASLDSSHLVILIKDNGCGMPSEVLSKLGRENVTYGKGEKGHGFGVMSACEHIRNWGGQLTFHSELGVGTVVSIVLPIFEGHGLDESFHQVPGSSL